MRRAFPPPFTVSELRAALESGHRASEVLRDIAREIRDQAHCIYAGGFEGPDTYSDCGVCFVCMIKAEKDEILIGENRPQDKGEI